MKAGNIYFDLTDQRYQTIILDPSVKIVTFYIL